MPEINVYAEGEALSKYKLNIAAHLILTLITCGLYDIYWNFLQMEACNKLLGKDEFSFWSWAIFSLLTCGLYHIYYQYQMGIAITEIQQKANKPVFENLPIISVFATIFGLSVLVDCVHQHEINKIVQD